jgi:hypothetical protein
MATTIAHQTIDRRYSAETLSLKIYKASQVIKLAAFATESRRILRELESFLHFRPELKGEITEAVSHFHQWTMLDDVTSEALQNAERDIATATEEMLELVYKLEGGNHG